MDGTAWTAAALATVPIAAILVLMIGLAGLRPGPAWSERPSPALAAPFLVSAGFDRVTAVVLAMLGHLAGVSFGAVGTPIIPQAAATGLAPLTLARATAPSRALVGGVLALHFA